MAFGNIYNDMTFLTKKERAGMGKKEREMGGP
jgi:hypothetical protein